MNLTDVVFDRDGLVTAVVQDADTGRVRMVGWMNRDALDLTSTTGVVHFWSRSRETLWRKGETSGNTLTVVEMSMDCDGDTLLIRADAAGPTCHTGAETCFGETGAAGFAWLDELNAIVTQRIAERPPGSYTAALIAGGVNGPARKVLEEAGEVAFAAKDHAVAPSPDSAESVTSEAADLLYHLIVLLAERGIDPHTVVAELKGRNM